MHACASMAESKHRAHAAHRRGGDDVARVGDEPVAGVVRPQRAVRAALRVTADGQARAVVVAHGRVGVVVVDVALALRADQPLAVLHIAHMQAPLIERGVHHGGVPLDVHAQQLLQLRVLEVLPRRRVHQHAARNRAVLDGRAWARVIRRVAVAVVGAHERLPPHVVLEAWADAAGDGAAVGHDDLDGDAARPQRQRARQPAHRQRVGRRGAAGGGEELPVAVGERAVNRHLHVGLDGVDCARLAARGDGEARAQLREEAAVAVEARAAVLRARHDGAGVARIAPRLNRSPLLGHHALAVAPDAPRALHTISDADAPTHASDTTTQTHDAVC
jgi:hypothetical protein